MFSFQRQTSQPGHIPRFTHEGLRAGRRGVYDESARRGHVCVCVYGLYNQHGRQSCLPVTSSVGRRHDCYVAILLFFPFTVGTLLRGSRHSSLEHSSQICDLCIFIICLLSAANWMRGACHCKEHLFCCCVFFLPAPGLLDIFRYVLTKPIPFISFKSRRARGKG